jgi:hypothetical protein
MESELFQVTSPLTIAWRRHACGLDVDAAIADLTYGCQAGTPAVFPSAACRRQASQWGAVRYLTHTRSSAVDSVPSLRCVAFAANRRVLCVGHDYSSIDAPPRRSIFKPARRSMRPVETGIAAFGRQESGFDDPLGSLWVGRWVKYSRSLRPIRWGERAMRSSGEDRIAPLMKLT